MAVCGSGAAGKKQVQRMVGTLLGLPEPPTPDHAADALAVAICHGGGAGRRRGRVDAAAARGSGWPDDRRGPRRGAGAPSRPRRDRRRRRRLPAHGLGRDAEGGPGDRARGLPARRAGLPRRLARPLRLRLRGGARPLRRAGLGQRGRPQGRDRGPLGRPGARAAAGDRRRRREALPGGARGSASGPRSGSSSSCARRSPARSRRRSRRRSASERRRPRRSPATAWSTSATRRSRPSSCSTASRATTPRS